MSAPTKRGRPAAEGEMVEIHIHLRLRRGMDDDLIAYFEQISPRRRVLALKLALRGGGMQATRRTEAQSDDKLGDALENLLM